MSPKKNTPVTVAAKSEAIDTDSESDQESWEAVEPAQGGESEKSQLTQTTSSSSSSSSSSTIDHTGVIESELTVALLAAFETVQKRGKTNKADLTLGVIKAAELMLDRLGVDTKRLYGGFLSEVVTACEKGMVLNDKLSGFDAKDAAGRESEFKNSSSRLGEKANVNFKLPEPHKGEKAAEYYARFRDDMLTRKGAMTIVTHRFSTSKSNEYCFDTEFLCFYAESKDVRGFADGKMKCNNMNIGGVSCEKCTRVHRLDKLLEYQRDWLAEKSNESHALRLKKWKPLFEKPVVQRCD